MFSFCKSTAGRRDRLDPSDFVPDLLSLGRDLQILEPVMVLYIRRVHLKFLAVFHDVGTDSLMSRGRISAVLKAVAITAVVQLPTE